MRGNQLSCDFLVVLGAANLVVILGEGDPADYQMLRLAWKISSAIPEREARPTLIVPTSPDGFERVTESCRRREGRGIEDDGLASLGLSENWGCIWLRVAGIGQAPDVLIEPEPATFEGVGSLGISKIRDALDDAGFSTAVTEIDESVLYTEIPLRSGETIREQVLGWDDIYGEEWAAAQCRLEVVLSATERVLTERSLRSWADILQGLPRALPAYSTGDEYEAWPLTCNDPEERSESPLLVRAHGLVQDDMRRRRDEITAMVATFDTVDDRYQISRDLYDRYKSSVADAKRVQAVMRELQDLISDTEHE